MAKKKTENIKAAPVLRAQGDEQHTPTPEQTGTRTYQIMDPWKDRGVTNLVDVKAVDGEITDVKVNGVPAGGGGGGMFTTAILSVTASHQISVPVVQIHDGIYTIAESLPNPTPGTDYTIVLTNGTCFAQTDATLTGSVEVIDPDEGVYKVTGNVTLS